MKALCKIIQQSLSNVGACCGLKFKIEIRGFMITNKLRGLSPHANYTDRAAAAGRRS